MRRVRHTLRSLQPPSVLPTLGVLLLLSTDNPFPPECASFDPDRSRAAPPPRELTPPPRTGGQHAPAEPHWDALTFAIAVDFTRALIFNDEERARSFVAPGYDLDLPVLRHRLGLACFPDTLTFTVRRGVLSAEWAVFEPTVASAGTAVTYRIILRPYPDQWRIVAVEP